MESKGWVKLWRKIKDSIIWTYEPEHFKVAMAILVMTSWKHEKVFLPEFNIELEVAPGELIVSIRGLAAEVKVSEQNVRTALMKLSDAEFIEVLPSSYATKIRLINWKTYQGGDDVIQEEREPSMAEKPPYEEIAFVWNQLAKNHGLCTVQVVSPVRRTHIRQRWSDKFWRDSWRKAIEVIPSREFLIGKNDRGWTADFDWFIRPETVLRLIEGRFSGQSSPKTANPKTGFKNKTYTKED